MTNTIEAGELIEAQYDWSTKSPSIAIVEAIAAVENVELTEVSVTLYDYVDPEALDALVTGETDVSVSFSVDTYQVTVDGNRLAITFD